MTKITLTKQQLDLAKRQNSGNFDPFAATKEEKEAYMDLLDKAHALEEETGEDSGDDLMVWFMTKYDAQEAE